MAIQEPPHPIADRIAPRVAVVVVNWNGASDTIACVGSLQATRYPSLRIIVVDNGSQDDSVERLRAQCPTVELIETGSNLGFAGGNNVGIRKAIESQSDFVWLLNNDTIVAPDAVSTMLQAVDELGPEAIVGPLIYYASEPRRIWYAGGTWNRTYMGFEHRGFNEPDGPEFAQVAETEYVCGCSLFAHADVFRAVGMLDDKFFLNFEETDWCFRARAMGHRCFVNPATKIWHKVSASFGGANSPLWTYFMERNILLWARRHLPRSEYRTLRSKKWRDAIWSVVPRPTPYRFRAPTLSAYLRKVGGWWREMRQRLADPAVRARLIALRDYHLRRFGDCPGSVRRLSRRSVATYELDTTAPANGPEST